MSDKVTSSSTVVRRGRTITLPDGRTLSIQMLGVKDVAELREQACAEYKRSLIQTYTKNLDLLPPADRQGAVARAFEKAEAITPDDLPRKNAWIRKKDKDGKFVLNKGDRFFHEGVQDWIETNDPMIEERKIDYTGWWMSNTVPGKLYSIFLAIRKCPGQEAFTLEEVGKLFEDGAILSDAAAQLGDLTAPRIAGNDEPAAA